MQRLSYYWGKFVQLYLTPKIIRQCSIDRSARVCSGAILNDVTIGRYSYVGHKTAINQCSIGQFCSIAGDCVIGGSGHPVEWVSTSPIFHTRRNVLGKSFGSQTYQLRKQTIIGNDVWIGTNVLIKSGVSIGDGAVIGMGSVVTKDVPDYEIWAGNPAKRIRTRFDEKTANELKLSRWWDRSEREIEALAEYVSDPVSFLHEINAMEKR